MNESNVIEIIDLIVFIYFGFVVLYFFVFSLASRLKRKEVKPLKPSSKKSRIVVLIPAYKEDEVIVSVAKEAIRQKYPSSLFDIVIIADSMQERTIEELKKLRS